MPKFVGKIEFPVTIELGRGLEGAITNVTRIGYVDGEAGELVYRGFNITELCDKSNYEETAYLLVFGKLPSRSELASFQDRLRSDGSIPAEIKKFIQSIPRDAHPMNTLQAAMAALGCFDRQAQEVTHHASDPAQALPAETEVAIRIIARISTVAAAIARARNGQALIDPDPSLSFTQNYLYMMSGKKPDDMMTRVMDVSLILQADHGMNASTFTAMIAHSSMSDMYSTVAAAIGSLRGPLHGGANEASLGDIQTIGKPERAKAWVAERLSHHEKVIGFGHRVYKAYDPRARVLKKHAEALCRQKGMSDLFTTADAVEREVVAAMEQAGKKIFPNVDFYSGLVYHALGFETPMFPVIFGVARSAGWTARVLEYLPENRLFRPRAVYDGTVGQTYVPMVERR